MFNLEKEMKPHVRKWMENSGLRVKEEFPSRIGISDLVGCKIRSKAAEKRLAQGQRQPIGPLMRVQLWQHIPNCSEHRTASLQDLLAVFSGVLDSDKVKQELDNLEKGGFIRHTQAGTYQKINGWHPLHSELTAFELKLEDWRGACRQAYKYLSFADKAYIALPLNAAKKISTQTSHRFWRTKGIGLAGVSEEIGLKILVKSRGRHKRTKFEMAHQTYAVERFWRECN